MVRLFYSEYGIENIARRVLTAYDARLYYGQPSAIPIEDLIEANEAASYVEELAGENANIIFGAIYDEKAQDECTITVIATGIIETPHDQPAKPKAQQTFSQSGYNGSLFGQKPQTSFGGQAPKQDGLKFGFGGSTPRTEGPQLGFGFGGQQRQAKPEAPQNDSNVPFRPQVNKEMTINIPDFLKNRK